MKEFLTLLSVCHTVMAETSEDGTVGLDATSPDEKALVEGAAMFGYRFLERSLTCVTFRDDSDSVETHQVLAVLEFTSVRKRMSVIVRTPSGRLKLYIKVDFVQTDCPLSPV